MLGKRDERHVTKKIAFVTVAIRRKSCKEEEKAVNKDERMSLFNKKFLSRHWKPFHS